jgi:hypothetical protein
MADEEDTVAASHASRIEGAIYDAVQAVMTSFGAVRTFENNWIVPVLGDPGATVTVSVPVAVSTDRVDVR